MSIPRQMDSPCCLCITFCVSHVRPARWRLFFRFDCVLFRGYVLPAILFFVSFEEFFFSLLLNRSDSHGDSGFATCYFRFFIMLLRPHDDETSSSWPKRVFVLPSHRFIVLAHHLPAQPCPRLKASALSSPRSRL
jgi:hypothetical protein